MATHTKHLAEARKNLADRPHLDWMLELRGHLRHNDSP